MAVVEILADYGWTGLLNTENTQYRRDVDAWFGPFRRHPAVRRFAALSRKGYTFDGPASTMVCLTAPPALALDGAAGACGADQCRRGSQPRRMAHPASRLRGEEPIRGRSSKSMPGCTPGWRRRRDET